MGLIIRLLLFEFVSAVFELNLGESICYEDLYQLMDFLKICLYVVHVVDVYELVHIGYGSSVEIAQLY